MERLTYRVNICGEDVVLVDRKSTEECLKWKNVLDRLATYEDLEEQGLLLKLLCKVGDIVYFPDESIGYIFPVTISQIIISDLGEGRYCVQYNGCFFNGYGDPEKDFEFDEEDFGKTVFLTQAEAEEALERQQSVNRHLED